MDSYDVVVIGAGTAGLKAAKVLKKHEANYLIIEKGEGGTLCADTGCMPSKALIEAANSFYERKKFDTYGIEGAEHVIADIPVIFKRVRTLRDGFVRNVREGMKEHSVLHGKAQFTGPNTLQVGGKKIRADHILICTGSSPRIPDVFKDLEDQILTTDTIFEQEDLPPSLAVIGMGSAGSEFSQALARLGIEVFAVQRSDKIAGIQDADVNKVAQDILRQDMRLYMNTEVKKAEPFNSHYRLYAGEHVIEVSGILVCAGRIPNVHDLGLENIDIKLGDDGVPDFDPETLQIDNTPIYIAGDVNNDRPLQHEAADEGERAAKHALGLLKKKPERNVPLRITFTNPPMAVIGSEGEIEGISSYEQQGRATLKQDNKGVAKLYANADKRITGAALMSPASEHIAQFLILAVQQRLNAQELLDLPFYHPTLEEGLRGAIVDIVGR